MNLFGRARARSAAIIDVAADSVGGACLLMREGAPPSLLFAERVPIAPRPGEAASAALMRALDTLSGSLVKAGGPTLARASGSGTPGRILAAVGAPYEEPRLRLERLHGEQGSFTFDKSVLLEAMKRGAAEPSGKLLADEAVVATFLDGYRVRSPWGRKARRASIVLLSSAVSAVVAEPLAEGLRRTYHTRAIEIASGALAFCRALQELFPHEDEYIGLVARGDAATLILVREGVFYAVATAELAGDPAAALLAALGELAAQSPLPHAVFIIAQERREELKNAFADPRFAPIWLSDSPPRLLPVLPEHLQLSGKLKIEGNVRPDLFLELLALFCAQPEEPAR
ncbi:MAG TPA: hypothetical protein VHC68_02245 [Candidatus Paceibacterota bacterium]|nr:hypothetical protein [Candidatus Paceibacterota bacterium]